MWPDLGEFWWPNIEVRLYLQKLAQNLLGSRCGLLALPPNRTHPAQFSDRLLQDPAINLSMASY